MEQRNDASEIAKLKAKHQGATCGGVEMHSLFWITLCSCFECYSVGKSFIISLAELSTLLN